MHQFLKMIVLSTARNLLVKKEVCLNGIQALFDGMRAFLSSRPEWDQYRVITSALAGFLFQNGCGDRCVAQHYLNGLFMKPDA